MGLYINGEPYAVEPNILGNILVRSGQVIVRGASNAGYGFYLQLADGTEKFRLDLGAGNNTDLTAVGFLLLAPGTNGVQVTGGKFIRSSSATEIGLQVTNASLTVGSAGSIQAPYLSSTGAVYSDAIGGNLDGCIGLNRDSDAGPILTLEARMNGAWVSVALASILIPKRRDYIPSPNVLVHPNQIYKCDIWSDAGGVNTLIEKERPSIDETICAKCGKPMVKGDQIHLFVNAVRKNGDLHAVFAHANH